MTVRIDQIVAFAVFQSPSSPIYFTDVNVNVVFQASEGLRRFSTVGVAVVCQPGPATRLFTDINVAVLCVRSVNFGSIAVVYPDVFPNDISYNSVVSIRFATDVTVVDSGDDQRVSRWDQPLQEYDITYAVRTMEQLQALIGFFRAMRGRLYAFCYQDWLDYSSSTAVKYEARSAPPPNPLDQLIGYGDGTTLTFQLTKTYATQSQSLIRPITRPQPGTVLMAINGVPTMNFTVDNATGLVTFTSPLNLFVAGAVSKTASGGGAGGASTFTAAPGTFTPLNGFVGRTCSIAGWVNTSDNCSLTSPTTIGSVNGDGSEVILNYAVNLGNNAESSVMGTSIAVNPAPPNTQPITAGFLFYVPVRFDTDTLPMTLEDFGIGSSQSIKLIEVRPTDPN